MFSKLKAELDAVMERDPAARSRAEVYFLYAGFKAVRAYRRANWFYRHDMKFIARMISQRARRRTGIEIHPGAKIGKNLFIDHGMGVVIGETAEVGDNCTIYQGVTLGGTGKDKGKRHPTIGANVTIGAGAKVLGPFKVGDNSKIAANAVVLKEVPPNSTCVGVPAHIVKRDNVRVAPAKPTAHYVADLDQTHIPDPVASELDTLRQNVKRLTEQLKECEESHGPDCPHFKDRRGAGSGE